MRALSIAAVATAIALAACETGDDDIPRGEGRLVVGLQTVELAGLAGAYHFVVKRDGVVQTERTTPFATGASTLVTDSFEVGGKAGALVEASVEVLSSNGGAPVITRIASARIVGDQKRLLRLRLDTRCVVLPTYGVACVAPATCITGACVSSDVGEDQLEDWTDDWVNAPPPDDCRPPRPGPPELILGQGQLDYAPLVDGQTLQLEQGPQGGHHIWMAARMKNLRQSGSTTTLTSTPVDGPLVLAPLSVVFSFNRDEGGYCKVHGLRYQVDVSGVAPDGTSIPAPAYRDFLGKTLDVTVTVVDSTGTRASSTKRVRLADEILCLDGTTSCNTTARR